MIIKYLLAKSAKYVTDKKGSVTLEFLLVLPIMVALYIGASEFSSFFEANRKTIRASRLIGDIVSQQDSIDTNKLYDLSFAIRELMRPYEVRKFGILITSIEIKSNGKDEIKGNGRGPAGEVIWSRDIGHNAPPIKSKGSTVRLPPKLASVVFIGQKIILTEGNFEYKTHSSLFIKNIKNIFDDIYIWPRNGSEVLCNDC